MDRPFSWGSGEIGSIEVCQPLGAVVDPKDKGTDG